MAKRSWICSGVQEEPRKGSFYTADVVSRLLRIRKRAKKAANFETCKQTQTAFKMLTITGRRRYFDCKYGGGGETQ